LWGCGRGMSLGTNHDARLPATAVVVAMGPAVERAALPSAGQHNSHRDVAKRAEQHHGNPQGDPHLATLPFLAYS